MQHSDMLTVLRRKRRDAMRAAREAHPAEWGVFVRIAWQCHARIMLETRRLARHARGRVAA